MIDMSSIDNAKQSLASLISKLNDVQKRSAESTKNISSAFEGFKSIYTSVNSATNSIITFGKEAGNISSLSDLKSTLSQLPNLLTDVNKQVDAMRGAFKKLKELKVGPKLTNTFQTAWKEAGKTEDKISKAFKDMGKSIKNAFKNMGDSIKTTFKNIGPNITKVTGYVRKKMDAFKAKGGVMGALTGKTGLLTAAKLKLKKAIIYIKKNLSLKKIAFGLLKGVKLAFKGVLTVLKVAKIAFNALIKANPIGLLIAGITALIAVGSRLVNWFRSSRQPMTENGDTIEDLAERYNRSTEQIEEDMERMGTTSLDAWESVKTAAIEFADTFEGCVDTILSEIADLMDAYTDHEAAIAIWGEQRQLLDDVAGVWNVTADEIKADLEAMGLAFTDAGAIEAWEAAQREALTEVGKQWGMCADDILAHMAEMGMSAEEWTEHMGQAWEQFNADVHSNVGDIINGFRKIPTEYKKSSEELREIMANNIKVTAQWQENMAELADKVPPGMLAHLESMGPEFNSVIQEMLDCEDELQKWIELMDDATVVATQSALDNLEDPVLQDAFTHKINETGEVISENRNIEEAFEQIVIEANERAAEAAKEGATEVGEAFCEAAAEALEEGKDTIIQPVEDTIEEIVDVFETGADSIESTLSEAFANIGEQMSEGMSNISEHVTNGLSEIEEAFTTSLEATGEIATEGIANIEEIFYDMQEPIQTSTEQAMENFDTALTEGLTTAEATSEDGVTQITDIFETLEDSMTDIGQKSMQGLNQGLLDGKPEVMATAQAIADAIIEKISSALQINSPSRVMEDLGGYTTDGFSQGMEDGQGDIEDVAENIADSIPKALEYGMEAAVEVASEGTENLKEIFYEMQEPVQTSSEQAMENFNTALTEGLTTAEATSEESTTQIVTIFETLKESMTEIGQNAMQGLENGLAAKKPAIMAKAQSIADAVSQTISSALKINSPSRVMESLGGYTMDGFALGMEDGQNDIEEVTKGTADTIVDTFEDGQEAMVEPIEETIEEMINVFEYGMENVEEVTSSGFASIGESIYEGLYSISDNIGNSLTAIEEAFAIGMETVEEIAGEGILKLEEIFYDMQEPIQTSTEQAMESFDTAITDGIAASEATAEAGVTQIADTFNALEAKMKEIGKNAMQGLENGLAAKKPSIIAKAQSIADSVSKTISSALKINSPSRVMENLGGYTMDGFAKGMEDGQKDVEDVAKGTADTIQDEFAKAAKMQQKLGQVSAKLYKAKKEFADSASALIKNGVDQAMSMQEKLSNMLSENHIAHELSLAISPPDADYQNNLMERLIDVVEAGRYIVMDSGELVGATYAGYDNAAGQAISYNSRWGR